ncbi:MAG: polyribonucleotide nucleotidyltransferase [Candidatus Gracilibacteria bacterium]|nr:polyribonucleotide nucleotidyltransferase [Candidatus Gracilibacteria bacterium]
MIIGLSDKQILSHKSFSKTYKIAGKNLTFESGKLALLADGSVVISDEEGNYLLTTAGISENIKKGIDFFPMTVEYQEKFYATGKIGGNRFMKRESRPSEVAVLNSRLIDRPIRPMFPKGTVNEVQIISSIMSSSGISDYGFYGVTGASLALMLSGSTEFEGPVSGCRVIVDKDDNLKFDPTFEDLLICKLDLTIAGTVDAITMVESQGQEVDDKTVLKAFDFAHAIVKEICAAQTDFVAEYSKIHSLPKSKIVSKSLSKELYQKIESYITLEKMSPLYHVSKMEFHDEMHKLGEETRLWLGYSEDTEEMTLGEIEECVYKVIKKHMRKNVLGNKLRLDGRKTDEVRPVRGEFGILPRAHGSALFQRGITQALTIATLGGPGDIQLIDDMFEQSEKRYIHHYNFPPFSVGEVRPLRGPGRREIGHGRLAEKAIEPILPNLEDFPYFIRCVSETLTCNGSSSMGAICGSSMALMDAGVPIKNIVSGVAMGMIYDDETGNYEILSDIQAQEDFLGDMDFKIAGSVKGITALQMDCKIKGLSMEVIAKVIAQSKSALDYIQTEMIKELSEPRKELSQYAPFILSMKVPVDKIREIIGKGGETIQKMIKDFEVEININDDGLVSVTAKNQEQGKKTIDHITNMIKEVEVGDSGSGKVVKILDGIGAIIDLGANKSGMIHISKIAKERVNNISDYLKDGDIVEYKVITVDKEKGKIGLERVIKD